MSIHKLFTTQRYIYSERLSKTVFMSSGCHRPYCFSLISKLRFLSLTQDKWPSVITKQIVVAQEMLCQTSETLFLLQIQLTDCHWFRLWGSWLWGISFSARAYTEMLSFQLHHFWNLIIHIMQVLRVYNLTWNYKPLPWRIILEFSRMDSYRFQ